MVIHTYALNIASCTPLTRHYISHVDIPGASRHSMKACPHVYNHSSSGDLPVFFIFMTDDVGAAA